MEASGTITIQQTPEMAPGGGAQGTTMPPEGSITYQRADGTIEQATSREDAITRCPVLGKMPVEEAEVLLELAAAGSEKLAEEAQDARTRTAAEDKAKDKKAEDRESEPPEDDPVAEAEAITRLSADEEDAATQEEIQNRRLSDNELAERRKRSKPKESLRKTDDDNIEDTVRRIIATNYQLYRDFRNGDEEALDILVNKTMELRKAA